MAAARRAIWSGSISFGLVNVPVKVFPAVHQQDIHFSQFDRRGARVRNKRVSEKSGREVDYDDIVKGYEVSKGHWVMVEPDELAQHKPRTTKTIDIEDFVELDEIDPVYYERTYYLAPAGEGATKAYALLLRAMEKKGKVGIGRVVMRTKQYLAALRPFDGVLAMSTMLFADEVVPRSEVEGLPDRLPSASDKELRMAGQIIDSLSTEWDPGRYRDTYRAEVLELLKDKAAGKELVVEEEAPEEAEVVDLMAALEASLAQAKKGRRTKATATAKTRAPARKKSA
jgi:DNA end-binding protein Ku